ncbi:unnamed protein product [Mytilus coruscus]|uniref:Uncharacterized protein n=1 Tax=Mytilus coruscus TaxID=42192 RepID=A0A6J8ARE1_MYTCO|nr:unnamed protein product [Mytilus coruscus]
MSASNDGLTDDIYNEVCDFSYLGGARGISQHYSSTPNTLYKVSECTKDTTVHLRRLNSSENCEFPEGLCKQCSIKMRNFVKRDKTQVKLNIEEDIDLDSQLTFLSTTTLTDLSQQSTSDWEADNASERDKFNRAINILGNGKLPTLKQKSWDDVSKSTKAMYLKFTSDVVNLIIQYIAPGQENKIMADLSEKYMYLNDDNQTAHDDMTKTLIQAYLDRNKSQTQIQMLSLFEQKFTKQKLIELIPDLTMSKFDRARKHANLEKPGQMINSPRIYRMRLSNPQLMHFIEFISSPTYHQAVGYG